MPVSVVEPMDETIPDKAYFRIGEVSRILSVEPYVVRYWESEFKSVRPIRTKSYQRLYRRKDVQELLRIKALLYKEKYTIAGAKKKLAQDRHVSAATPTPDAYQQILSDIKKELEEIRGIVD